MPCRRVRAPPVALHLVLEGPAGVVGHLHDCDLFVRGRGAVVVRLGQPAVGPCRGRRRHGAVPMVHACKPQRTACTHVRSSCVPDRHAAHPHASRSRTSFVTRSYSAAPSTPPWWHAASQRSRCGGGDGGRVAPPNSSNPPCTAAPPPMRALGGVARMHAPLLGLPPSPPQALAVPRPPRLKGSWSSSSHDTPPLGSNALGVAAAAATAAAPKVGARRRPPAGGTPGLLPAAGSQAGGRSRCGAGARRFMPAFALSMAPRAALRALAAANAQQSSLRAHACQCLITRGKGVWEWVAGVRPSLSSVLHRESIWI